MNHLGNLLSLPKTMVYQDWGKSQEFVVVVVVVVLVSPFILICNQVWEISA